MKFAFIILTEILCSTFHVHADEQKKGALTGLEIRKILTLVEKKKTPNIYSAVYYPGWKTPLDGLKSVTAEAIAEHANRRMKDGVRFKIMGEPISEGDVGGVLLRRSGGGIDEGVFPAYLFHSGRNGWGFLGFPIPYKAPRILGKDGKFMAAALNDPTPYDGVLYEFGEATKARYELIAKKMRAIEIAEGGSGQPAAALESKPEGEEKLKPESEGRSR